MSAQPQSSQPQPQPQPQPQQQQQHQQQQHQNQHQEQPPHFRFVPFVQVQFVFPTGPSGNAGQVNNEMLQQLFQAGLATGLRGLGPMSDQAREFWARAMDPQGQPTATPASKEAVNAMPVRKVTESDPITSQKCAICQDCYEKDHEVIELPCKHTYHKDCCMPWLKEHNTCPLCRANVDRKATNANSSSCPSSSSDLGSSDQNSTVDSNLDRSCTSVEAMETDETKSVEDSEQKEDVVREILSSLPVRVLKRILNFNNVPYNDCIEKSELVSRITSRIPSHLVHTYLATSSLR